MCLISQLSISATKVVKYNGTTCMMAKLSVHTRQSLRTLPLTPARLLPHPFLQTPSPTPISPQQSKPYQPLASLHILPLLSLLTPSDFRLHTSSPFPPRLSCFHSGGSCQALVKKKEYDTVRRKLSSLYFF